MKSKATGKGTSPEVTNISSHGIWLYWNDAEYFLDYDHFPWFKEAKVSEITNLEVSTSSALHWPDLDVDLSLKIIQNPDGYPHISRG